MNSLDIVVILVCILFAFNGFRQGLVVGILSFAGFLGGGALGAHYAPLLHRHFSLDLSTALFGFVVVVAAALIGQTIAVGIGSVLRRVLVFPGLRILDSLGGAVLGAASVLLVAWFVGTAIAQTTPGGLSREVRHSTVLHGVDTVMPASARTWFSSFRRLLDTDGFPEVFGGIGTGNAPQVSPPDHALARSAAVRSAAPDVVKVLGDARSCSQGIEGSGFVYATDHVMTNAHVVAGVSEPTVSLSDGRTLGARVVLYDPDRDIAVLYVPDLGLSPLSFGSTLSHGQQAIALGYPEDGPFTATAARVRSVQTVTGPNIYQTRQVSRSIYSLYASVHPGNSGGPLVSRSGKVAGVVFARSVDSAHTGYALTASEAASDASHGASATSAVSTGGCA